MGCGRVGAEGLGEPQWQRRWLSSAGVRVRAWFSAWGRALAREYLRACSTPGLRLLGPRVADDAPGAARGGPLGRSLGNVGYAPS